MIFVTVGSAEPFDRLIRAVDGWAGARARRDVFAQIGEATYVPANIEHLRFMSPADFRQRVNEAGLIVAHAGMGSIITALEAKKPILVMPRREHLRETRNDHQVATVKHFAQRRSVIVAWNESDLMAKLDMAESLAGREVESTDVSVTLISTIRDFIAAPGGARTRMPAKTFRPRAASDCD